ncbi:MAG: cytochrome c biogenesis protein CcsA [Bacteroidota bacterium]|nr:cytochrome c biogenesis protein CcsA [Bacteroidota bacterium]MDP3144148.1 cytochrome c biogenesis protein CcsA [Bacteroidota bacterium]MDP3558253.1 cytochrome c biogenesis protein CcsA [Bacteroidota bacterium]
MNEIQYIAERLWAGHLGNAFVVLSFVSSLLAFISYYLSANNASFQKLARLAFNVHGLSVIGIIATLFYMLLNHYFEYQYVWQHSNSTMDMKYILSCFWEGQEGSFLLWTFWNVVLGMILKRQLKNGDWEIPVMTVFSLVQVFLASMLLGVYFFDYKIGTNPFLLLRDHAEFSNLPFLQKEGFVPIKLDGRGLNPLLMNYWMTIHPPTLFLGFASTLVPFAFAIGALWNKKYNDWQKIALPWTYFCIMILGIGILMGGAWAYEALSFGGFWAWDPVENSSLVPWLVIVAAGHTMIINKNKGGSLFTTHFLAIGSFLLVLYSTFLTRSGVLGNASVHAFTDLGMTGQLVLYVLTFIFITVALLINDKLFKVSYIVVSLLLLFFGMLYGYKKVLLMVWLGSSGIITFISYYLYFPKEKDEEELFSREFWMFLGSLVFLLSGLIITYFTSIPVINKLFNTEFAPPKVHVYNTWMMPFAILIMLLIAASQFLKYKKTNPKKFLKRVSYSFILALLFGLACSIPLYFMTSPENKGIDNWDLISYSILFITGLFAVFANLDYFIIVLKGKVSKSGAAIAHIGFAMVLIGALISTSKKVTLAKNTEDKKLTSLGKDFDDRESILLTQGDTLPMGPYLVTYKGKKRIGINIYFTVDYFKLNKDNKPEYDFSLEPHIQENPKTGQQSAEPDTKHYLDRDIYTHITAADLNIDTTTKKKDAFTSAKNYVGHVGDTIFSSNALVIIDSLRSNLSREQYEKNDSVLEVTAVLRCVNTQGKNFFAHPKFIIQNNVVIPKEDVLEDLGLKFVFWKINPDDGTVEITMSEKLANNKDFIVMKAFVFPFINVLWLGCLIMAFGTGIAIVERIRKFKVQL